MMKGSAPQPPAETSAGPDGDLPSLPHGWRVPAFSVTQFRPKATRHACVIPVINEGQRIVGQLREMHRLGIMHMCDVILADGGSGDGSTEPAFLSAMGLRASLVKKGPGKLSAQLRMAYAWALMEGYEGIVTIDGNGKDSVDSIPQFLAALDRGVDYAQASRFMEGGSAENTPLLRLLAIRLLHAPLISLGARRRLTDTTQGFRGYSRRYLADPRVQPFRDVFVTYELLAYLSVRASQIGLRVEEIPTRRQYPKGEIPTKISGIRGSLGLVRILLNAVFGAYAPRADGHSDDR